MLDLRKCDNIDHPIFASLYSDYVAQGKVEQLVVSVRCTLTELFNGCVKTLTYEKKVLSEDGQNVKTVVETKTIEILPGSSF